MKVYYAYIKVRRISNPIVLLLKILSNIFQLLAYTIQSLQRRLVCEHIMHASEHYPLAYTGSGLDSPTTWWRTAPIQQQANDAWPLQMPNRVLRMWKNNAVCTAGCPEPNPGPVENNQTIGKKKMELRVLDKRNRNTWAANEDGAGRGLEWNSPKSQNLSGYIVEVELTTE